MTKDAPSGDTFGGYRPELDSLRIVLALTVAWHHWIGFGNKFFQEYYCQARVAVLWFMVLSGYVCTKSFIRHCDSTGSFASAIKSFYTLRFFRIAPLYYFAIFLYFFLYDAELRDAIYHLLWLPNLSLHVGHTNFMGHYWTLGIEIQFYLIFPVLIYYLRNRPCLAALSGLLYSISVRIYMTEIGKSYLIFPFAFADCFMIGMAAALLEVNSEGDIVARRKAHRWMDISAGSALACFLLLFAWNSHAYPKMRHWFQSPHTVIFGQALAVVIGAWVIARLCAFRQMKYVLANPMLQYLGKISYGFYVYHAVGRAIMPYLKGLNPYAMASILTIITIAISALSWHLMEHPLNALGKRLSRQPVGRQSLPPRITGSKS